MSKIVLTDQAISDLMFFANSQPKLLVKATKLIDAVIKSPFVGIGKPEPLKHNFTGYWLRRIDESNRIIYTVQDNEILIISFRGHYD